MNQSMKTKKTIIDKIDPLGFDSDSVLNVQEEVFSDSRQGTAKKAIKILVELNQGYKAPIGKERTNLVIAFAKRNKIIYGKAFDVVKFKSNKAIDLGNLEMVERHIHEIMICEIKSTKKDIVGKNFEKYFFGLSTAELLVAQNLKEQFQFVFVNINTKDILELTLKQVFEKSKGIYPVWSIQF